MKKTSVLLLALGMGCYSGVETDGIGPDALEIGELETDEIVDNLVQAGFPEQDIEVQEDGSVVLGGDAVVGLQASREIAGTRRVISELEGENELRQYRTNNLVDAPQTINVIGYVANNANGLDATMQAALSDAVANYNNVSGLDLDFTLAFGSSYSSYDIVVYKVDGSGGGSAGFPSGGNPYKWVQIHSGTSGYGQNVVEHVMTHEIGHTLGFRHTDYYNRSLSCGSGGNEGDGGVGAVHIPGTPTGYDANSIMLSCFSAGEDGEFGANDITALQELYGTVGGGGGPVESPTSCFNKCGLNAGSCYCDNLCAQYGDCCADKVAYCG